MTFLALQKHMILHLFPDLYLTLFKTVYLTTSGKKQIINFPIISKKAVKLFTTILYSLSLFNQWQKGWHDFIINWSHIQRADMQFKLWRATSIFPTISNVCLLRASSNIRLNTTLTDSLLCSILDYKVNLLISSQRLKWYAGSVKCVTYL